MAMSKAPRGVGRPTEMVVQCPYDPNHIITHLKINTHLAKCRKAYRLNALKTKQPIDMFVCQYNHEHIVLSAELIFHESRCPDRNVIRSYQLNVAPLREAGLWPYEIDMELFPPDQKELQAMFGGVDIGIVQGRDEFGKKRQVEDVKYPARAAQREAEKRAQELWEDLQKEERQKKEMIEKGLTQEEMDEIDDWNKDQPGPGYDFRKVMQSVPPSKYANVPPYFNKCERKKYQHLSDAEWFEMKKEKDRKAAKYEEELRKQGHPTPGTSGTSRDHKPRAGSVPRRTLVDEELLQKDEESLKSKRVTKVRFAE